MPIKPENRKRYPPNWKEISKDIRFNRAKNRCEVCGVKNYAVGYWEDGKFCPTGGNIIHDSAGRGELPFKEAKELVNHCNDWCDDNLIVIVLTVAHLDHKPENCDYSNLKAMCQKCHNKYDSKHRKQTIKKSKLKGQLKLGL
jgi:hypothetical protein